MNYYLDIKKKIQQKKAIVAIIGLGYVGMPLLNLASNKFKVFGLDIKKKILNTNKKKNITITNNYDVLDFADIIIYTLPTPVDSKNKPDLTILNKSIQKTLKNIKKPKLIIIESTSYPGTTRECYQKFKKKYELDKNIFFGISPERVDPGNKNFEINNITKIVSGLSKKSLNLIEIFYKKICKKVVISNSCEAAELAKIYENIFRAVNIGLANETKQIAKAMKIDFNESLNLATTKPFGFMRFDPGPGVGGHCIPVDPFYLSWKASQYKISSKFIELSGRINSEMPKIIFKEIMTILKKKKITKPMILCLGLSYKKNIDDYRNSPSLKIFEYFLNKKIKIKFNDNFVKKITINNKEFLSTNINNYKNLYKFDAIIILTDHDYYNYKKIIINSKLIFDTRNKVKSSNVFNL